MYYKNFDHTLERLNLFLTGKSYPEDQNISIKTQFYPDTKPLRSLKVIRDTGRVKPSEIVARMGDFKEDAKIGDLFGKSWDTHWFLVDIEVPKEWLQQEDSEVHFIWNGKSEASLYTIDGAKLLQAFTENVREKYVIKRQGIKNDLEDPVVNKSGQPNTVQYLLEMACNEMFGNFVTGFNSQVDMKKEFKLEKCEIGLFNRHAWNLFFNFELLRESAEQFEKTQSSRAYDSLYMANQIMNECYPRYDKEYPGMIERAEKKSADYIKSRTNSSSQHTVFAVGHCHIDTAWLWPYAETKRKIARSWSTQIELMRHYKDFNFCASQIGQYYWLKKNNPEVYERVKEAIKGGRFEVVGGSWVEHDGNVPSGESMVRQLLYGQRFAQQEFGKKIDVFFLPDTFGYSPQLPQIVKSAGIKYFLTQKLSWSCFNKFPHNTFYWRGIDGTEILTHFPPADTYNSNGSVKEVLMSETNFKDKGRSNTSLLLFGDGDGGGGPQIEHIERLERVQNFEGCPKVKFATCHQFFENLEQEAKNLMKWEGELYLELHNGTYTSVAEMKNYCRRMENHLRDIEILSVFASLLNKEGFSYDIQEITDIWHTFLIDQFHDVLPGTCIGLTYIDTRQNFKDLSQRTETIMNKAVSGILSQFLDGYKVVRLQQVRPHFDTICLDNENQAAVLFNTLTQDRFEHLRFSIGGNKIEGNSMISKLGIAIVDKKHLEHSMSVHSLNMVEELDNFKIENRYYKVTLNKDGSIHSWKDKRTRNYEREICKPGDRLNKLSIHQDVPFFWDAWDVMLHDFETVTEYKATQSEIVEKSESRVKIRFTYKLQSGLSTIEQTVCFYSDTARVDFQTEVDWHESKKLLKAYFPVDIRTDYATFDIQNGTIRRPTHANTSWDAAKHEVFGHKFCDISENRFGVALLNDCKYGYSVRENNIGLSLLKAPKFPDHEADMGHHSFVYSLLPHDRPLEESTVFDEAHRLNTPLWVAIVEKPADQEDYPIARDMINNQRFIEIDQSNIQVSALKRSEDHESVYILRLYEDRGEQTVAKIKFNFTITHDQHTRIKGIKVVNSLEEEQSEDSHLITFDKEKQELTVQLRAYKIVSLALHF